MVVMFTVGRDVWLGLPAYVMPFLFLILLPLLYPVMVLASLFNAALVFAAHERMNGRKGRKRAAWKRAVGQLGPIARFNLLAMLVAGILAIIGQLLDKLRLVPYIGQALNVVGSLAWAAASFFVIPILVVEREEKAFAALRSSAALARTQWGKTTAGVVTIALAVMVPLLVLVLLFAAPMMVLPWIAFALDAPSLLDAIVPVMIVMAGLFVVAALVIGMVSGAFGALYQTALYRYAKTGKVSGPYTKQTLVDAWAPYRG